VQLPVYLIVIGDENPDAPGIGLFGGIHGVERIGTEVVLAYMHSLIEGLSWSPALQEQVRKMHIVLMPIVNPASMVKKCRCNPNGVDLMRNAPIDAEDKVPFLLGGHRINRYLPWYRGHKNAPMEIEAQALCNVVEEHLLNRPFSLALDCHSGYGRKDYLWLPYASTRKPFPNLAEMYALKTIFDRTYPNHTYYRIEPQSLHYTTHGDLWDYLHINFLKKNKGIFLPLTLEMGSWQWIKKNPRQLLRFRSLFNPVLPHRQQRILRRHLVLIEFLLRAVHGYQHWIPKSDEHPRFTELALRNWYKNHA
ncbi:MAG: hypothetical protein QG652_243, partial [Pseudomonadota bacterium]|nr:hypothetical protein [Pseudomonadota bacterium]